MVRSSGRIAIVVALAGGAIGLSGWQLGAQAAGCETEGTIGEVILPGVGAVDVDTGARGSGSVCVGTEDTSVQVFEAGVDYPGDYLDTAVKVCLSTSSDPVCTYDGTHVAQAYLGVANEDLPAVDIAGDGVAVAFSHGMAWDTLLVGVMGMPTSQDLPRVCVEVGSARCENGDPVIPPL